MLLENSSPNFQDFVGIIDKIYDEVLIYDHNYNLLYVNDACYRHYGITPETLLTLPYDNVTKNFKAWSNALLPAVYEHKKTLKQYQKTFLDYHILTVASPIFDEAGNIKYVVMCCRDANCEIEVPCLQDLPNQMETSCPYIARARPQDLQNDEVLDLALKMARVNIPCLISGESGTGKSFLAKYIHAHSKRANKPLVVVSCPAIPSELFEAELFGYKKGAFSGAITNHDGLFAQAEGGTLFLDEISELPLAMQGKLLHVLQEKEFRPVGGKQMIPTDVRIIVASNRNLKNMIEKKLFRQDLFFRINVFDISLSPLRESPERLRLFANYFLEQFNADYKKDLHFTEKSLQQLQEYPWPGNIRELQHLLERLVILTNGNTIDIQHLPKAFFYTAQTKNIRDSAISPAKPDTAQETTHPQEEKIRKPVSRKNITEDEFTMLYAQNPSSRKLAEALNISQSTASRLIRKYRNEQKK